MTDHQDDAIVLRAVTLDCPDAGALAAFYGRITGGTVVTAGRHWARVDTAGGRIYCQAVEGYTAPTWPTGPVPMQAHLDFLVTDRAAAETRVLAAGAQRSPVQPNDHCSVYTDPAGHPFCLSTWGDPT